MSGNDTHGDGGAETGRPASDAELSERLRRLDRTLARDRGRQQMPKQEPSSEMPAFGQAWRLTGELVAGVAVGAVIGWAFDQWLGTSPWGMIVFLLLGFTAGVLNLLRATGSISRPGAGPGSGNGL